MLNIKRRLLVRPRPEYACSLYILIIPSSVGFNRSQVLRAASDGSRLCLRHWFKRCLMVVPSEGNPNGPRQVASWW